MEHRDLEDSILKRRFAPMPRRRAVLTEEGGAEIDAAVKVMKGIPANQLAKAAEELLEHFEAHEEKQGVAGGGGKAKRMTGRVQENGSDSSVVGEAKISGLITPEESSSSKNALSEDGIITVSLTDAYTQEWTTASGPRARSSSAGSSARTHDCEADGCYGLTARFIDDDRLSDDYAARGGGKKRKVPASAQQGPTQSGERDDPGCGHTCGHVCDATTSSIVDRMNRASLEDTSDQQECPHVRCCSHSSIRIVPDPVIHIPKRRATPARTAQEFEKRLFLGRKAQVMGLLSDAVTCLSQEQRKPSKTVPAGQGKTSVEGIPTKDELEELVKALEYTGLSEWEGDRVGAGPWDGHVLRGRIKGTTLTGNSSTPSGEAEPTVSPGKLKWRKRGRVAERYSLFNRKPVKRGGWIPEGTFEFEMPSSVASAMQKSTHDLHALRAKVTQLLTLTLSSPSMTSFLNGKPNPMVPLAPKGEHGSKAAPKDTAQPAKRDHPAEGLSSEAPITIPSAAAPAPAGIKDEPEQKPRKAHQNSHNVIVEPSVDDPDYVPPPFGNAAGAKKGKKKKKKSAMANAANPHHVKNYVPSRRPVNPPQADMPNLVDFLSMLFFPPPTRFLNSKPRRKDEEPQAKTKRREPARPSADATDEEYVCCFCEYDLFFGSEQAMDKAVRRRKKVLERRQKAQEKAAGLIAGRGMRTKPARGDGNAEDDERCAGGEQCRCAEIRAQEGQSRDADSRGIEDTYSDEGRESDEEEYEEDATDPQFAPDALASNGAISEAELGPSNPPRAGLPEVETFDLDETGS